MIRYRDDVEDLPEYLEGCKEPNKNYEYVNNPSHYGGSDNVYEAIKVIEAWELNFNIGTAIRYLCRQGKKPSNSSLQDLQKAKWYIKREIKKKESEGKNV